LGFLTYRLLCHTPAKIRSRAVLIRGPHISAPLCLPHNAGTSRRFLECVATSGGVPVTAAWPKEHARGKNAPLSMPVNLLPLACDILE
jgi:hypothetical protein